MPKPSLYDPKQYIPSLQEVIGAGSLKAERLAVALAIEEKDRKIRMQDRCKIPVTDGEKIEFWTVTSMGNLFRGDRQPPDLSQYPREYIPAFYVMDGHAIAACDVIGDRTDEEFEEVFSALRRRPDGKSATPLHQFFWQVAALMLGMVPLSEAEYTAILSRLERSTRSFHMGHASRNYIHYVRQTLMR